MMDCRRRSCICRHASAFRIRKTHPSDHMIMMHVRSKPLRCAVEILLCRVIAIACYRMRCSCMMESTEPPPLDDAYRLTLGTNPIACACTPV